MFQVPKCKMLSFDIININIITLRSPLREPIHHDFYSIYYTIEIHTYKHLGGNDFSLFTYRLHQQSSIIL